MRQLDPRWSWALPLGAGFLLYLPLALYDAATPPFADGDGFSPWYGLLAIAALIIGVAMGKAQGEHRAEPLAGLAGLTLAGFFLATILLLYMPGLL